MPSEEIRPLVGSVSLHPTSPVPAGGYGTWRFTYRAGKFGMNDGATLKIAIRWASDWGPPQFDDPRGENYVTAATDGNARLRLRYDRKGHIRPWQKTIIVNVYDGYLRENDSITVTLGDTRQGSAGSRAQTFVEKRFRFKFLVDCYGTGNFAELPVAPLEIISDAASGIKIVTPSACVAGDGVWALVKAEDMWGNPCSQYLGTVRFIAGKKISGLPEAYEFQESDKGVHRIEGIRITEPGCYTIRVTDRRNNLRAESNPIVCHEATPLYIPYWGDLQGQSEEDIGTGTLEDFFAFARDRAPLDFVSHQPNDFNVTNDAWERMQAVTRLYYQPERFVPFLGMEWSGTPAGGGDHNLIYLDDRAPIHRSSHWQIGDKSDLDTDRFPVQVLFRELRGTNVLAIPHVGGRRAPMEIIDPALVKLVEIYSCWGSFEWVIDNVLQRGFRVGFVANSDGHSGRPGAEHPGASDHFGVKGGLTCVYAKSLTKQGLWEALNNRRTYATTGERMVIAVTSDGHWMGEEYSTPHAPRISVSVTGTCDLERVLLMREATIVHEIPPANPTEASDVIRISWGGARGIDRNKTTVWDGSLQVSNAEILSFKPYGMDTPVKELRRIDSCSICWKSTTVGDFDGVEIQLSSAQGALIHFQSELATFSMNADEISHSPAVVNAGGIRQQVVVQRLPKTSLGRSVRFEYVDEDIRPRWNAYYVKAVQSDGNMGWSSPIYVFFEPASTLSHRDDS